MRIRKKARVSWKKPALFACAAAAAVLVLAAAFSFFFPKTSQQPQEPSFGGFVLLKNSTDGVFDYCAYAKGNATMRLRVARDVGADSARIIANNDVLALRALYDQAFNPYPDVVSGKIEYAPEFLPAYGELEAGNFTYMEAFLTSRMTYGAFTQDTAIYRGVVSWKYCAKKRELRQLEVILPKQEYSSSAVAFAQANICN